MTAAAALRLLLLSPLAGGAAAGPPEIRLLDIDGHGISVLPRAGDPTTVFVFTSTDCPIANRYAPELRRLQERFAPQGVRFWFVHADPAETSDAIRRHAEAYGLGLPALRDPRHELVRFTGARVTPEAVVLVAGKGGPSLVYRGRIDDRNVAFGRTQPAPKTHDLEDVLVALGSGTAVPLRTTTAVGCAIPPLE